MAADHRLRPLHLQTSAGMKAARSALAASSQSQQQAAAAAALKAQLVQTSDVRAQLRFLEDLDKMEKERRDREEREMLFRAAKVCVVIERWAGVPMRFCPVACSGMFDK